MDRLLVLPVVIVIILLVSLVVVAEENIWSFTLKDEVGDDYGPGDYKYPQDQVFAPYKGLFDLLQFSIRESGSNYILNFEFVELKDPWQSNYGFSLPLIEIYIDNEKGGSEKIIEKGANIALDSEHPWNKLLKLSGWWLLLYDHDAEVEENVSITTDIKDSKWQVKNSQVTTRENTIKVKLPKDVLGEMIDSHIQLLVGSFDPFGPGHFRKISDQPSAWKFYSKTPDRLSFATRVIDTILPEGMSQKEVLAFDNASYPQLYSIHLKKPTPKMNYRIVQSPFFYILLLVFIAGTIMVKRKM